MMQRARRWIVAASLGLLIAVVVGAELRGYSLLGYKWGTNQVYYYVNPANVHLSPSVTIAEIQKAASAWSAQTAANIEFVYGGTTGGSAATLNYKNEVFFRNDGSLGQTYWWADYTGRLLDADVVINQGYTMVAESDSCAGGVYLRDMLTHEFGHALGLMHSSATGATMNSTMPGLCDTTWRSLSSDDISGVEAIYGRTSASATLPAAPSQLIVSPYTANLTGGLLVSWADNANDEAGYVVERSADGASFAQIASVAKNATSYVNLNLAPGTRYYYRVAAFNSAGTSAYSNVGSNQTEASSTSTGTTGTTGTLTGRAYKVKGSQKVELRWSGFSTALDVYRNGVAVMRGIANDGTEVDPINAKGGGTYTYRVCAAGTSTCSNTTTVSF